MSAAIVAAGGSPPADRIVLTGFAVLIASAGANGLTNYLDRHIDARMKRTRDRALASGRVRAQRALPVILVFVGSGLVMAWALHPFAFAAAAVGTLASGLWRKRATCVFPQGMLASWAPVLMGWFAVRTDVGWELALLCALVGLWLPLHVWSIMLANREDYRQAGLTYFPMSRETRQSARVLLLFALVLAFSSVALGLNAGFGWVYLVAAAPLGALMVISTARLAILRRSEDAWRLYWLSSYPYLGIILLVMCLDVWLA